MSLCVFQEFPHLFAIADNFKLSPSRLPVIYVFGKKSLQAETCVFELVSALNAESLEPTTTILLKHDVAYTHQAGSSTKITSSNFHILT